MTPTVSDRTATMVGEMYSVSIMSLLIVGVVLGERGRIEVSHAVTPQALAARVPPGIQQVSGLLNRASEEQTVRAFRSHLGLSVLDGLLGNSDDRSNIHSPSIVAAHMRD